MAGRAGADFGSLHCPHKEKTGCRRPGGGVYQRRQCRGPSKGGDWHCCEAGGSDRKCPCPGKRLGNQKRLKLKVRASELYPEDYDFSIVFDSVENRKARHQMERKYVGNMEVQAEE